MQDARYLQVTASDARPYSRQRSLDETDAVPPSLPTPPGTDWTIGRQGPGVRMGRLGTLESTGGPGREEAQRKEGNERFVKKKDNLTLCCYEEAEVVRCG